MSEARAEADQILSEARAKADSIRQRAQEQADTERKRVLDQATQEAERLRRQATSSAQVQARMLELEQREKLLSSVFDAARKKLTSMQQWKEYGQITDQLLREALTHLGSNKAQIRADEKTQQYITKELIDKVSKELKMQVCLKEPLEHGIGIIVQSEDGRNQYDNTLETRLNRIQDTLRSPVYRILKGEAP